jgi:hypothetical protein
MEVVVTAGDLTGMFSVCVCVWVCVYPTNKGCANGIVEG